MKFYLAVLIGALIYMLFQLNGVFNKPDFSWKVFLKTNAIPSIINIVVGWALVFAKDELAEIYPITLLTALILGVSGQAIFKKITNIFDKKMDTKLGM